MASSKKSALSEMDESVPMDMSPMIDLTFLLLVFFMVASHIIKIEIDRRVKPPIAANSKVAEDTTGRVVVNILSDGSVWALNQVELPTTEAIVDYVRFTRQENEGKGVSPTRLLLRADQETDTRAIKRVVQAAGEAGVVEVIFGSLAVEP